MYNNIDGAIPAGAKLNCIVHVSGIKRVQYSSQWMKPGLTYC